MQPRYDFPRLYAINSDSAFLPADSRRRVAAQEREIEKIEKIQVVQGQEGQGEGRRGRQGGKEEAQESKGEEGQGDARCQW